MLRKYNRFAIVAVATLPFLLRQSLAQVDTFVGPGIIECEMGECDFSVDPSLGCSDPCHTSYSRHMYEMAFEDLSRVSNDFHFRDGEASNDNLFGEPCFHKRAEYIYSYFPDQYVHILEGCTARCIGCTFAQTQTIRKLCIYFYYFLYVVSNLICEFNMTAGPALLECQYGRCTNYTTQSGFDCGDDIEAASDGYGSFHTPTYHGKSYDFYGYEGIDTGMKPIKIPKKCTLDCSGCTVVEEERRNRLFLRRKKRERKDTGT